MPTSLGSAIQKWNKGLSNLCSSLGFPEEKLQQQSQLQPQQMAQQQQQFASVKGTGQNETTVQDWPDSLRRYIERCFAMCADLDDKICVDIILKGKLTSAAREGTVLTKDWENEPLPNLLKVSFL